MWFICYSLIKESMIMYYDMVVISVDLGMEVVEWVYKFSEVLINLLC